ncbi:TPA: hypothetical protein ACX6RX_003225 [Photobacterium damselae]
MTLSDIKILFEDAFKNTQGWKRLIGSQFQASLSRFLAQVVYRCTYTAKRRLQESFLSKATRESSILAAAEDKAYIGLKISPSFGLAELENRTNSRKSIPELTQLISQDQRYYLVMNSVDLQPKEKQTVNISQLKIESFIFTVSAPTKWLEYLLPVDISEKTHQLDVYVNGELWTKRFKFRNTNDKSKAYMEQYTTTKQLGVRFGNNITGAIPTDGSVVELRAWITDGDTTLLDNQQLSFSNNSDLNESIGVITKNTITGGAPGDTIDDIRNGALYSESYDDQLAWDGDYRQFIKNNVGGLIWLSVWGEEQEELINGYNLENINKIYISAYSDRKSENELKQEISSLFVGREGYNENYIYRQRIDDPFTISVTGKIAKVGDPVNSTAFLKNELIHKYGKNAKNKPSRILVDEIWDFISDIKHSGNITEFTVTVANLPENEKAGRYSYIDIDNSQFILTY